MLNKVQKVQLQQTFADHNRAHIKEAGAPLGHPLLLCVRLLSLFTTLTLVTVGTVYYSCYMFFSLILVEYTLWHYGRALENYVRLVRNGRDFIWYYFSIPVLVTTLFAPYKRMTEERSRRFDFGAWVGNIIINLLSRLIGMFMRLVLLTIGGICFVSFMTLSVVGYAFWLASPLLVLGSIIIGIILLLIGL